MTIEKKKCAQCFGGLGLISHHKWHMRFCSKACKKAYENQEKAELRRRLAIMGHLSRASP
jgi:hypothetical protein